MPFFRDPNLDDKESGNVQLSSAGTSGAPDGGQAQGQGGAEKPFKTGSNFTNIDSYLKNNNSQQFGQEFGNKVQSDINASKTNMDQTAGQVKSQIQNTGYVPTQDEINKQVSNAGRGTTAKDVGSYNDWIKQSYGGPSSLADNESAWGQYWGQAEKAKTEAQQAGKESGRFALLDQYFRRPNYGFGDKSLDNLLIQGGGGFTNAKDLRDQAAGLSAYGDAQSKDIASAAASRAGAIEQSKKAARDALGLQDDNTVKGGAIGDFQTGLDARTRAAQEQATGAWNGVTSDLGDDAISSKNAELVGLPSGENLYNLDLKNYLTRGQDPTRQQVASDDDYARYQALTQLAGLDPTYLTPDQRVQAGSHPSPTTFDADRFHSDQATSKAEYQYLLDDIASHTKSNYEGDSLEAIRAQQQSDLGQIFADQKLLGGYNPDRRLSIDAGDATGVRPSPIAAPSPSGADAATPMDESAYPYSGHPWDDPNLAGMFDFTDPKNPKLKVR